MILQTFSNNSFTKKPSAIYPSLPNMTESNMTESNLRQESNCFQIWQIWSQPFEFNYKKYTFVVHLYVYKYCMVAETFIWLFEKGHKLNVLKLFTVSFLFCFHISYSTKYNAEWQDLLQVNLGRNLATKNLVTTVTRRNMYHLVSCAFW